jgi:adenylylsulfate reductase subunit B
MSIRINRSACVGCGKCTEVCPGHLLRIGADGRAEIRIPEDCWGCASCLKICPAGAIAMYLGADIGGRGAELSVEEKKSYYIWTVRKADGEKIRIPVNRMDANKY